MTAFLYRVLSESDLYRPEVISLATSASDKASVLLHSPGTWREKVRIQSDSWNGVPYQHVGAVWSEFEFQRYQSRRVLTDLFNQYDLIQIVGGTPAWAWVAHSVPVPKCLFAATMASQERASLVDDAGGWRRYWVKIMTHLTAQIDRRALASVDYVFAESDYTRNLFAQHVKPECLGLGPPGVDTRLFTPGKEDQSKGCIISVGRFRDPRKNVRMLLEAYRRLRHMLASAPRLALVGRTGLSPQDTAYAESLGIIEFIDLHTDVDPDKLCALYQSANLFVLSSNEEGLGIVILDAMACGLPVVTTDCGGPATAVIEGETGLLTPVKDPQAFAEKMLYLLQNPNYMKQMGIAGRRRVEEKFSIDTASQIYLNKYDELLNRHKG